MYLAIGAGSIPVLFLINNMYMYSSNLSDNSLKTAELLLKLLAVLR